MKIYGKLMMREIKKTKSQYGMKCKLQWIRRRFRALIVYIAN